MPRSEIVIHTTAGPCRMSASAAARATWQHVTMPQHHLARYLGLAGSIVIAVTAFLRGALPEMGDDPTPG